MDFLRFSRKTKLEKKSSFKESSGKLLDNIQKPNLKRPSMTKILYSLESNKGDTIDGDATEYIMKTIIGEFFDCVEKRILRLQEQKVCHISHFYKSKKGRK